MEKEKIGLKERLLAGLAYLNVILLVVISIFYAKDRRGFVFYHCIQSVFVNIALFIAFILIVNLAYAFSPGAYAALSSSMGPISVLSWISYAILAALFIAASSGKRFRIPIICGAVDWLLVYIDKSIAEAEAKKKKV